MILPKKYNKKRKVEIDLTGPDGNVFNLISIATDLATKINERRDGKYFNVPELQKEMMSSDYEHAINVLEKNFGEHVIMYR